MGPLEELARAGGGGSSSGGGHGDGIIALVGYIPAHFLGAWLRRGRQVESVWVVLQVLGWIAAAAYAFILAQLGILGDFMAIAAFIGMGAGLYGWFGKLQRNKKVDAELKAAAIDDPAWNEQEINTRVQAIFMQYQRDWSARQMAPMQQYMTPAYYRHAQLMIAALLQAHRANLVDTPTISQTMVVDLINPPGDSGDIVIVGITAKADDKLFDDRTGQQLSRDTNEFTEFWRLKRSGETWLLDGIQPATASTWVYNQSLQQLADTNGYFYSLDWGSLLIPTRGQIFKNAKFGTSDINNHVIGLYNQSFILQLYTYSSQPAADTNTIYLVAQTNVPREYGEILVRRRSRFINMPVKGLQKISMEWSDFNKKYDVFASSAEGATSFELLHPVFMEKLEALPFEINIEVVDNIVYFYAPEKNAVPPEHYQMMLELLQEAYKQMKL